jgi:hypothetical protein
MSHFLSARPWIWMVTLPVAAVLSIPAFLSQLGPREAHPQARILGLVAIAAAIPVWLAFRKRWRGADVFLLATVMLVPVVFREPRATAFTIATFAAACGFGNCVCGWLKLPPGKCAYEIVISAGIGMGAWIAVMTVLGFAGLINGTAVAMVIGIALIACRKGVMRVGHATLGAARDWKEPGAFTGIQIMFFALMILILQPVVIAPSILYDSLPTHLAASRNLAIHHAIQSGGEYSYLPQGFELMMGASDTLAGQAGE